MTGTQTSPPDYAILSAIQPIAAPPRTSVLYQVNLLLVTLAMVLLPLIYLALVGAAVYGVYYHAVHHWGPIMNLGRITNGRVMALKFMVYFIPLLVGAVVVFFMFKPIFAGRPKRAQPLALNPADNPLLYAFIEKICETVGSPSPKRIDLDCDLNAAASFRRGFLSMAGNDLVLTIGLPLVANLTAAEFAGVIAHEFGHFTQSLGMRLSYVIRTINHWFVRVVYQRDAWDEALDAWANTAEDGWVTVVVWTAQIGVWFARMILRLLMYVGLLIGGFMMRQMEYDADAWEIKLAGSATFERTQRKLATLSAAMEKMYRQMRTQWAKNNQLPDNLSELLRQHHESLSPETLEQIEVASGMERTGWFDSHPCVAARIRQARRAQDLGVFHDERPASALFTSFDHPARFVTLLHYTDDLDIPVTAPMLVPVATQTPAAPQIRARGQPTPAPAATDALHNYFLGLAPLMLPIKIPAVAASTNYEADATELLQITSSLLEVQVQLEPIATQYHEATEHLILARTAAQLLQAGAPVAGETFGLAEATVAAAHATEATAIASRAALRHSVREVGVALARRLQLGLALRLADSAESRGGGLSAAEIAAAISFNAVEAEQFAAKEELATALDVFDRIAAWRQTAGDSPELDQALTAQIAVVNLLAPVPSTSGPKPALQLQLNRPKPGDAESIRLCQREANQWLTGYAANLSRLVEAAQSVENLGT